MGSSVEQKRKCFGFLCNIPLIQGFVINNYILCVKLPVRITKSKLNNYQRRSGA